MSNAPPKKPKQKKNCLSGPDKKTKNDKSSETKSSPGQTRGVCESQKEKQGQRLCSWFALLCLI